MALCLPAAAALNEPLCDIAPGVLCRRTAVPRAPQRRHGNDGAARTPAGGHAAIADLIQRNADPDGAAIAADAVDRRRADPALRAVVLHAAGAALFRSFTT